MIKLYSNGCVVCNAVEKKIKDRNLPYVKSGDFEQILKLGFTSAPVVEIDTKFYTAQQFLQIIDTLGGNN